MLKKIYRWLKKSWIIVFAVVSFTGEFNHEIVRVVTRSLN
jgi:hypothetical protein